MCISLLSCIIVFMLAPDVRTIYTDEGLGEGNLRMIEIGRKV